MNKDNNNEEDSSLVADVGGADDNFSVEIGATAYELKQLLKNDKKKEFYAALGVEKNYPEQDQMQLVLAASKTCSSNMKMACENLFTFVSLLAVTTGSKDGMSTIDKLENVALKFDFWMKNCILQEQHREGILHLFPESRWPQDFITHCNVLQDVDPSTTWLKSHHLEKSEKPLSYLKKVCFGYKVREAFKEGRKLINSYANVMWIDPNDLPSGTNVSALLLSIRRRMWYSIKASSLAEAAIRQDFKRNKQAFKKSDHGQAIAARALSYDFQESYFPQWWLTFIYLGYPIGAKYCCIQLESGVATSVNALQEIREVSSKVNRRQVDAYSTPNPGDTPSSGEPSSKKRAYELVVTHNKDPQDHEQSMIMALNDQIKTIKDMGDPEMNERLPGLYRELVRWQDIKLAKLRSSSTSSRTSSSSSSSSMLPPSTSTGIVLGEEFII
jgi:hypothetical protein